MTKIFGCGESDSGIDVVGRTGDSGAKLDRLEIVESPDQIFRIPSAIDHPGLKQVIALAGVVSICEDMVVAEREYFSSIRGTGTDGPGRESWMPCTDPDRNRAGKAALGVD